MLGTPVDAWYVWIGIAAASVVVTGTAIGLTDNAPPGADRIAAAIDEVAGSPYAATSRVPIDANGLRLGTSRLAIRTEGGTAYATLARGPVTPVRDGRLGAILEGRRAVEAVYDSPAAFARALRAVRQHSGRWRRAPETLTVRRVTWGDVSATLVG